LESQFQENEKAIMASSRGIADATKRQFELLQKELKEAEKYRSNENMDVD
jgi:cellobiose-specific phosphotransferase system component IIA